MGAPIASTTGRAWLRTATQCLPVAHASTGLRSIDDTGANAKYHSARAATRRSCNSANCTNCGVAAVHPELNSGRYTASLRVSARRLCLQSE